VVKIGELLSSIAADQGQVAAREMAKRLKAETGVDIAFTVVAKGRKRKHRWGTAQGRVVAVRFTDGQYAVVARRAAGKELSIGDYLKWLVIRSHSKKIASSPSKGELSPAFEEHC
jgi:hypothetical protein